MHAISEGLAIWAVAETTEVARLLNFSRRLESTYKSGLKVDGLKVELVE